MATLALTALGSVAGSALLPAGVSVFGATITGAAIGQAVGSVAGSIIDESLFGSSGQSRVVEGARMSDLQVMASTEGVVIPRLYGRARLGGQIIWATRLEEEVIKTTETSGGGKGGLTGGSKAETTKIEYRYYANFAVGLCEGEISRIGRVWADNKELDLSNIAYRIYKGTQDQQPDSFIEAIEGAGKTPAYRGLAYIVFERLPLERFGNRIPQLNFEIFRPVDDFGKQINAITIIPGAGEYAYETSEVTRTERGVSIPENTHTRQGKTDWSASLDDLQDSLPNLKNSSLIVSWFGTDLSAGQCQIRPCVENLEKQPSHPWSVAGLTRSSANTVSEKNGRPAYGGTPSDRSVVSAIKDMKARGIKPVFYPFILMDIPENNTLANPHTGENTQPPYPWRGRITVDDATDGTSQAQTDVTTFTGTADISDFTISGETVSYIGPSGWSFRRMIFHYAHLCKAAGGVDAFIIGSELRGLTQIRDQNGDYPFVTELVQLAADVKTILGPQTKITYAADWSEYFGHHPQDGTGNVYFHLDPLWSSPNIDAIGIDLYWPLSDWRDNTDHLDLQSGARSIYDLDTLKNNITSGEGYDWYYASQSDREAQIRTPITDGAGKPWVFRYKDIHNWWSNQHYNRPAGIEAASPTAWNPMSKPFWFTEFGCPAVDKGTNQPNVFYDPKSSESAFPYHSTGARDDTIQRRYIHAILDHYAENNPVSPIYNGPMVDTENAYVYTWDARPYPAFPYNSAVWSDAANWPFGHWLNGRIGDAPLAQTVEKIMQDYGFPDFDASRLYGSMQGFVIDRIMSVRDALQSLELAFFFDSYESEGQVRFRHRGDEGVAMEIDLDDLVETSPAQDLYAITRRQETELPAIAKLSYIDSRGDYRQAAVDVRRQNVKSERVSTARLPIVMEQPQALSMAEIWLQDIWSSREKGEFILPPRMLTLEPTDLIKLKTKDSEHLLRLTEIADSTHRASSGLSIEPSVYNRIPAPDRTDSIDTPPAYTAPEVLFLDLPLLGDADNPPIGYVAARMSPWPGAVNFYASPDQDGFNLAIQTTAPATTGTTETDLHAAPSGRWDRGTTLRVALDEGELYSAEDLKLFNGANLAAIETPGGNWEVFQFRNATLIAEATYDLTMLLRGQGGTEPLMADVIPAGARFILLDAAVTPVTLGLDQINLPLNWKAGPANRDIGHNTYADHTHAFIAQTRKPLSPVHIKSQRIGNDFNISWFRRTRTGGDSWELTEVPLGETQELYEIEILDGSMIKRTLISTTQKTTYTEADQLIDWGSIQASCNIRIYQISGIIGRGFPAEATIG